MSSQLENSIQTGSTSKKSNNHWNLRLSQESKEILQLLKKYLRLTQDEQIQLLGQLVLYHEMLPSAPVPQMAHDKESGLLKPQPNLAAESPAIALQKRIRELARFSPHKPTPTLPHHHLQLQRPLPLENQLAELKDRLLLIQERVENLTKAIDAQTELQILDRELEKETALE